jgi:hypothetical protein
MNTTGSRSPRSLLCELFGDAVETLAGIDQFIDRGVLPVVRSLL